MMKTTLALRVFPACGRNHPDVPRAHVVYFHGNGGTAKIPRHRVLTDLTGEFNRVVLEYEAENVGEFEARRKDYSTNEAFRAKMKGYTDLWMTGRERNSSDRLKRVGRHPTMAAKIRYRHFAALGAKFWVREFHNAVLRAGTVPLELLERQLHAYIRSASGKS